LKFYQDRTTDSSTDQLDEAVHDTRLSSDEQLFVKTELRTDLFRHLSRLQEDEKLIVMLRWFGDKQLTLKEVAEATRLTTSAIQQTEQRAFAKLRSLLTTGRLR
jgi:RNA polymerase sigma factor (sigma-70 family)